MHSDLKTPELGTDFSLELARERRVEDANISEILQYLNGKASDERLLCREDINPLDIKPYLPEVALFDLLYSVGGVVNDVLVKLAGTRLDSFYGVHTNKKGSESINPYVFKRILQSCQYCVDVREPIVVTADMLSPNKDFVTVAILYVPLSTDGQIVNQVFIYNQVSLKSYSEN